MGHGGLFWAAPLPPGSCWSCELLDFLPCWSLIEPDIFVVVAAVDNEINPVENKKKVRFTEHRLGFQFSKEDSSSLGLARAHVLQNGAGVYIFKPQRGGRNSITC